MKTRIALALTVLAGASTAALADPSALNLFVPFDSNNPAGWTQSMNPNDDGSSDNIQLGFDFCFYQQNKNNLWINNNGNLPYADILQLTTADLDRYWKEAFAAANRPSHDLVAQVLLAAGADPNARTKPGVETGSFMRDCRTKGETPLHRAAAFGSVFVIKRLLAAGATVDARDANGETPLAWASWHLRPDTVLRLLCYGPYRIRPDRDEAREHGPGWGAMDLFLLGKPRQ